jgi:2-polyprenyl-6-methoxyphenol hydroxylase-like FAD-dependent oxidoreductase
MVTQPVPVGGLSESWGRGERFGYAPLPDGRVYCYATANAPEGAPSGGLTELKARFGGWHDPLPALLDATTPDAVLHHDLYDLPPLKTYTVGNVVLAGDAAHAMTPNLGQGACQALEDAVVLGTVMSSGAGLGAYDRQRRPRTQMITRRSHQIGVAAEWASPAAVTVRNTALRLLPPTSFARSLAPVLDWAA